MSRFIKGQTVYMDRGLKMKTLIVKNVIDNGVIPIFQYTFEAPHDGFACGEQSIRDTPDGADLKLSECFKENHIKENTARINTIASALRQVVDETEQGYPKIEIFNDFRVDFKPNLVLTKWLAKYANGKIFIHVGSGQGHLVNMLKMSQARAIGIEPNINKQEWIKWRLHRDTIDGIDINEILEGSIERYGKLLTDTKNNAIVIIARPKNKDFVRTTLQLMPKGMELIYIVTDELPMVMNEPYFGGFDLDIKLLEHEGISEDNEFIYSITERN